VEFGRVSELFLKPIRSIYLYCFDSPYHRETYRYTPLLALLLTPNGWLHPSFGKYLFALCDIVNGLLIYRLLLSEVLQPSSQQKTPSRTTGKHAKDKASLYAALHLLNPLVFSISTRGSSESVLSLFVLLTLYAALKQRWNTTAILLGLSTHWKIYPVIYGVACIGVISAEKGKSSRNYITSLVNCRTIKFGLISAGTFFLLGAGCYLMCALFNILASFHKMTLSS
jgi:phosphatidylinositol glycan class M